MIFNLLEKDKIPDFLIRIGIRNLLKQRLIEENKGSKEAQQLHLIDYVEKLKASPVAINTLDANEQHYEVPTEFYKYVLGKRMKYSGGYWPENAKTLDESEESMLKLSCERAQLKDGHAVLDLGCGWGSVSLYVAEKFPNCKITAVSNSKTQKEYIDSVAKEKGFKNLTVITQDMNDFYINEKFDRIISVEMLEHMKNYQKLFAKLSGFLKPEGLFFIHIFTHKEFAYPFEVRDETDWMAKYFFTGGMMPSHNLFLYFQDDLNIRNHWVVNGTHYGKTSEAWLENMDKNKKMILPILEKTYGKENLTKWWSYWRIFFLSCAELFAYRSGGRMVSLSLLISKEMKGCSCHFEQSEKSIFQKNDLIRLLRSKQNRPLTTFLSNLKNIAFKYVRGDRSKALLIFIVLLLFQCSMKSADIRKGEYLDKAKETTLEDFFEKRMQNRIKKVQGANWEIFFESNEFVYFGFPVIALFREGTFLEEFFKVDRLKLETEFPTYKKFDGIDMKSRCFELLGEKIKTNTGGLSHSFDCSATLEEKSILVTGIFYLDSKMGR